MKVKKAIYILLGMVVILLIGFVLIMQSQRVEKFSEVRIVNSYGTEIENYNKNKMAFMIEKNNESAMITVNGEEYQEGKRFYRPGTYEIEVVDGAKKEKSIVKINQISRKKESEYGIYVTTETLQALFVNLQVVQNKEQKGYFWTARTSTINMDVLSKNLPNLQISEHCGTITENEYIKEVLPEVKAYIQKVLQEDENAYFRLYTDDVRFYLESELFGKVGLDDSRFCVTLYTNGTLSYVREYELYRENKYERFLEEKENYLKIVENLKSNVMEGDNDHPGSYMVDEKSPIFTANINYDYMLISALTRENITYEMQYPEKLKFEDAKIAKEMQRANLEKVVAVEKYRELSEESKQMFLENINLNKQELDEVYFTNQEAKYLIITGTVPFYEHKTQEEFEEMIRKVYQDYKEEYIILYKPHPRALPTANQETFLSSLDIKVLPGAIPMEAILFIYPNLQIGGFASSLYMSADKGKTEFFFVKEVAQLVSPLDQLYDSLFSGVKFYY